MPAHDPSSSAEAKGGFCSKERRLGWLVAETSSSYSLLLPKSGVSMRDNHILLGLVLGATAVTLFGASLPMTRLAVSTLDPWFVTSARGALAGLVAALVLALFERPVPWSDLPRLADDRSSASSSAFRG